MTGAVSINPVGSWSQAGRTWGDCAKTIDVGRTLAVGSVGEGVVTGVVGVAHQFDDQFGIVVSSVGGHGGSELLVDTMKMENKLGLSSIIPGGKVDTS